VAGNLSMTSAPTTQEQLYLETFQRFESDGWAKDPAWVNDLRRSAMERFKELGFPTARRGNEAWKYTDIAPIARTPFSAAFKARHDLVPEPEVERSAFAGSRMSRLVFVDGHYQPALSATTAVPSGVVLTNLAEAMHMYPELVRKHLAQHASYQVDAFTALNTAFIHDGAFISVPDNTDIEGPIQVLFLSSSQVEPIAAHPRLLVVVGKGSSVSILETYAGLSDGSTFTNAVAEYVAGEGSTIHRYRLQRESAQAFHVATTQADCQRDSRFDSVAIDMGAKLARHNLNVLMGAEGAACSLDGLYSVEDGQHVDNQIFVDHATPHTTSHQLYKGILDGKSHAVFNGRVLVRPDAQKTEAHQVNKNLMLSERAEVDTKPQLEIFADDVKCNHGAAVGQIDQNALFYMKSRGMDEHTARSLLMHGFVSEVIAGIAHVPIRALMDGIVQDRLAER
jgi:Fe-S cluster assembly protein SufD